MSEPKLSQLNPQQLEQVMNTIVEHRVNDTLQRIRQMEQERDEVQQALKLEQMLKHLESKVQKMPKVKLDPECLRAEQSVLQCYHAHTDRPLDCWKEVEDFKRIAEAAEGRGM